MDRTIIGFCVTGAVLLLAACGQAGGDGPVGAKRVLPDAPDPTPFTRAYSMTESADGTVRIFARETYDDTILYEMRRSDDGTWSEPVELDIPRFRIASSPHFSPYDGYLYFSTDEVIPVRGRGKDGNLWRVKPEGDGWGEAEPLPESVNTGARETSPVMDTEGRLYFSTDHPHAGGGGLDIMMATYDDAAGDWTLTPLPELNSPRADTHLALTADGSRIFFYSHREPKLGVVDIWTATRGADGTWSAPQNLGAPVNTPGIDFGAGLSGDGETFFFSREGSLMQIPLDEALAGVGTVIPNAG